MKCLKCGGEWTLPVKVSKSLDNCPFCGSLVLNEEKARNIASFPEFLQYMIQLYGSEIYTQKQRLSNIVADLYTGEEKMKRIYRRAIIDDDLSQRIFKLSLKPFEDREIYYDKIICSFIEANYIRSAIGLQVVEEFALGLKIHLEKLDYWVDEFGAKYSKDKKTLIKGVNIESYQIRKGTIVIEKYAFEDCFELFDIDIPNTVMKIEENAFAFCKNLGNIHIPDSVIFIGAGAFDSCESFTDISLPDSVIHLGVWAFADCKNLTHVRIPNLITSIGEGTFSGCEKLCLEKAKEI